MDTGVIMDNTDSMEAVMEAFEALKSTMKSAGMAALEAEDFGRSREVMSLMEELVALQRRAQDVLGAEVKEDEGTKSQLGLADGYPRFFRRGSVLVKEGLRRGGESTYEQKMPREVYDEVLAALRSLKQVKKEFHAPDVIGRVSCPNYSVYLLLLLLQEADFLENPQRGLYRFKRRNEPNWAAGLWESIGQEAEAATH